MIVRYRRGANPVPSRTTHNTILEVVWTLVPVLILVAIAVPSIRLLAHQYAPPKADITVKATGNQWYWTYTYPDHGGFEIVSNGLSDADAKARGEPRLLAVDERMVVPAGRDREGDRHRLRRHPQLGRPRFLGEDGRGARAASTRPGSRPTGRASITASASSCAAPATPTCRSRSRCCRRRSSPPGSPRRAAPCRAPARHGARFDRRLAGHQPRPRRRRARARPRATPEPTLTPGTATPAGDQPGRRPTTPRKLT